MIDLSVVRAIGTGIQRSSLIIAFYSGCSSRKSHRRSPGGEREWKEEALNDLPREDEKGPSSIRPTLELFERQHWGETPERLGGAHNMGFPERIDTSLS